MSRVPRALVVEEAAEAFGSLVSAAAAAGTRLGWLDLVARPPTALDSPAELGFLRAVAVDERGSVAVKARRGQPVLRDLLREHFVGCAAVLVRVGEATPAALRSALEASPGLRRGERGWCLEVGGGERELGSEELLSCLGRPSFWRSLDAAESP